MKELYNKPMLTVDEFKLVDVMTESGGVDGSLIDEEPED